MILGMTLSTFTLFHVVLSLVGIASGFIVVYGFLAGKRLDTWNAIFLAFTVLTSLTGFLFPFHHLLPSHVVGILSLVVLAVAILARYPLHMRGAWGRVYVVSAMLALYLNVFVLVVQALKAAAPTQKEPPFLIAQIAVMAIFAVLTIIAARKCHHESVRTA
jgi:hypothetical protein